VVLVRISYPSITLPYGAGRTGLVFRISLVEAEGTDSSAVLRTRFLILLVADYADFEDSEFC
jgi:hypothetical protein